MWLIIKLVVLSCLSWLAMQLPGDTDSPIPPDENTPFSWRDLYKEFETQLSFSIYKIFAQAVVYQNQRDYTSAEAYYTKLRHIPRADSDQTFDLSTMSKVFRYNLRLLDKQKKRFS